MRLHCASLGPFNAVPTVGIYFVGFRHGSWPNSRTTASCIRPILWSPVTREILWDAQKYSWKYKNGERNATVSNTVRVPLTPLRFNKIRMGLFIRRCHFGINELYGILYYVTSSVKNHVGLLFEEVTAECLYWRANRWGSNCLPVQTNFAVIYSKLNIIYVSIQCLILVLYSSTTYELLWRHSLPFTLL